MSKHILNVEINMLLFIIALAAKAVQVPVLPDIVQSQFILFVELEDDRPLGEKIAGQARLLKLEKIVYALSEVENCTAFIAKYNNSTDKDIQAFLQFKKENLAKSEATLKKFEDDFKKDPSLLKHAKMIKAEEDRLDKIDMAKGKEYFMSKEREKDFAKKMAEFCKQFEKPE